MPRRRQTEEEQPNLRQPTQEEEMLRRQSADRPTAESELAMMEERAREQEPMKEQPVNGALDGFRVVDAPIKEDEIRKAILMLNKYKSGKANLEKRVIDSEQWYKLRHWECMRVSKKEQVEPTSGWLFNCLANKHADAMDNLPAPNVLPREEADKGEAEMLSSIVPVILDQCEFEKVYDQVWSSKLKSGTGIYGVFWDGSKLNGLGDISIKKVDILNMYWEPGITDIQDSQNVFVLELQDNEMLVSRYPQLEGKLHSGLVQVSQYVYDDTVDTSDKSLIIDWYYKKVNAKGKTVLHMCKFVGDTVIFATENEPDFAERGLYDHGRYPFEFDTLFDVEGTPAGFGYVDVGKSAQEYIDRGNQAIMENMLANAKPRYFIRDDGSVNEEEYGDLSRPFVHVDGNLGQDSIVPIQGKGLDTVYYNVLQAKIDEIKEVTGNRDINNGGTSSGVTAASAIAAMQEAGSRMSRDANKKSYRVFKRICLDIIELIRQFYTLPRCFRIMGNQGAMKFIQYSNQNIAAQEQGMDFGVDMGVRVPLFDIEVSAQKQSPYTKVSQNELALQFYTAGFFNPNMAEQALCALDMMDFDRKNFVVESVKKSSALQQQMMMLAQLCDKAYGTTQFTDGLSVQLGIPAMGGVNPEALSGKAKGQTEGKQALGDDSDESYVTERARKETAERTAPQ